MAGETVIMGMPVAPSFTDTSVDSVLSFAGSVFSL
jgi:hypothetical protein